MNDKFGQHAQEISTRLSSPALVPFFTILLPILLQLLSGCVANASPTEFLEDHRDEDGEYDPWIVERGIGPARRAARRSGEFGLPRGELRRRVVAAYDQGLRQPDHELTSCMVAAQEMTQE